MGPGWRRAVAVISFIARPAALCFGDALGGGGAYIADGATPPTEATPVALAKRPSRRPGSKPSFWQASRVASPSPLGAAATGIVGEAVARATMTLKEAR